MGVNQGLKRDAFRKKLLGGIAKQSIYITVYGKQTRGARSCNLEDSLNLCGHRWREWGRVELQLCATENAQARM
jgi:hypothetical protein